MQSDLSLITQTQSFHSYVSTPSNPNDVVGEIYFQIGQFEYPSRGWVDRAFSIIGWWEEALSALVSGQEDVAYLVFGEGSYEIVATRLPPDLVELRFMEGIGDNGKVVYRMKVTFCKLLDVVSGFAKELEIVIENTQWSGLKSYASEFDRLKVLSI